MKIDLSVKIILVE